MNCFHEKRGYFLAPQRNLIFKNECSNFLLNEITNFGCYKLVMYNLHHGIILPYKMKSYVFQFVGTMKSEEFEVLFFCIAAVEVLFLLSCGAPLLGEWHRNFRNTVVVASSREEMSDEE